LGWEEEWGSSLRFRESPNTQNKSGYAEDSKGQLYDPHVVDGTVITNHCHREDYETAKAAKRKRHQ
jgi:hypothetical protein